ncbi:MAG: hypothetical protein H6510_04455 [Acidobacteria bacterium]|nr:hypothetical protein [Acidobacteriota bacterium]MCB9397048.1 hypothetical protein [Acidobacteriota bacterium]
MTPIEPIGLIEADIMDVLGFVSSIYLGDRGCKKIVIDGWARTVCIQVDTISRIRSLDGNWHYYNDENLDDGYIVFKDVQGMVLSNNGKIPNDYINYLEVIQQSEHIYLFTFSANSVEPDGPSSEVILQVTAGGICLVDPNQPEQEITE